MFYLLMNCFPYSGFMAMSLVPGLTEEGAGVYAGILSSSFMVGRAMSSYPWGKVADIYGRKSVLIISLVSAAFFSISFGLSPNFAWAVGSRLLLGLGNGIMLIARTLISELARGDHDLEASGMGRLMSMVGYGMLLAPAIGGGLSEPMTQYPNANWFGRRFDSFLSQYPFILPNIVACILSLVSLVLVVVSIEETLPQEKRRPARYMVPDFCQWIARLPFMLATNVKKVCCQQAPTNHNYEQVTTTITENDDDDDDWDDETNSIQDDLRILEQRDYSELTSLLSTPGSRASYSSALHRPSVITTTTSSKQTNKSATIKSLMSNKSTRDCLIAYWANCFVNVALNEAFPLFCMSKQGGLSFTEAQIGVIGTGAGCLFCICQYFVFSYVIQKYGLTKSMVYASLLSNAPAILFPISKLLPTSSSWTALLFLGILMAVIMIFNSVFYANITIVTNRTVEASHRATLNGLSSLGASISRGLAPLFAGSLVSICLSSGIVSSSYGALVIYTILTVLGMAAFAATFWSVSPDEEKEENPTPQDVEVVEGMNIVTAASEEEDEHQWPTERHGNVK